MEIQQINREDTGQFIVLKNEIIVGKLTYFWVGTVKFSIEHTEVNPNFKGQGIGKKLILAAVAFARKENKKIIPNCSYAKVVFEKNTDLQNMISVD